jgi:hypothetical protein
MDPSANGHKPIEFRSDGSAVLHVGGERHVLRSPKLGEYRTLRTSVRLRNEERQQAIDEFRAKLEASEQAKGKGKKPEEMDERAFTERMLDRRDVDHVHWYREVFAALSDKGLPEADDDLPAWFPNPDWGSQLLEHWRTTPLPAGAQ